METIPPSSPRRKPGSSLGGEITTLDSGFRRNDDLLRWPRTSAAAEDGDVIRDPPVIRNAALFLRCAFGYRRAPEMDPVEIAEAIRVATRVGQKGIALARRKHGRHRAEPRCEIALKLRIDRMLEPHIGAIGMRSLRMHHGGVGPTRRSFLGHDRLDGLLVGLEEIHLERP